MFEKCEFCEKWDFENVNIVKNEIQLCEFCETWDFRYVNFVENVISEIWILRNMRFSRGEFLDEMLVFALVWFLNIVFYFHENWHVKNQ